MLLMLTTIRSRTTEPAVPLEQQRACRHHPYDVTDRNLDESPWAAICEMTAGPCSRAVYVCFVRTTLGCGTAVGPEGG